MGIKIPTLSQENAKKVEKQRLLRRARISLQFLPVLLVLVFLLFYMFLESGFFAN